MSRTYRIIPGGLFFLILVLAPATWAGESVVETTPGVQTTIQTPLIDKTVLARNGHGAETAEELSLVRARELALRYNAGLIEADWARQGTAGLQEQAGLLPNPELSVDVENFAGDGDKEGFDSAETTVAISQLIELGGKRSKRQTVADLQKTAADFEYEAQRLNTLNEVTRTYVEVVAAQERLKQAKILAELAQTVQRTVTERVEAGKVSPVEQTRAGITAAAARLVAANAGRDLVAARSRLAACWGSSPPRFTRVNGDLVTEQGLPLLEELLPLLKDNPDWRRSEADTARSRAEADLAESLAIPDITFSVGYRQFQDTDSQALVAGLAIPLPLFDRNQGGRKAAAAAVHQSRAGRDAVRIELQNDLADTYQRLASAHAELTILDRELLPGAESAFEAASLGYREGKFGLLDVLDAQRTLSEVRSQFVSAQENFHLAKADIERLIAQPLPTPIRSKEVH